MLDGANSVATLAPLLREGEVSPVELTEAALENIARLDPVLNAFITVLPEAARAAAVRAEAEIASGHYRGPFHGIPIAHKDVFSTRGIRTTAHSRVLTDHVPTSDATAVERLAYQGAIMLGKLNTYEFACGATASFGVPVNPWDPERTTGGSSAGSGAAVAASLCLAATGTDTGGSIRSPASYCGVVGLKPTYGRVSRAGVIPVSWSLDHVGGLTRTVRDAALMLAAIEGFDPADPSSSRRVAARLASSDAEAEGPSRLDGIRLGVPWDLVDHGVAPDVRVLFDDALHVLERLGAELTPIRMQSASLTAAALQGIMAPEATLAHRTWLQHRAAEYAPFTRRKLLLGACMSATHYLRAQQARHAIIRDVRDAAAEVDAMVWPTTSCAAPRLDEPEVPTGIQTRLTNLTGAPSLSVPCGFTPLGLPVGIQINGRHYDEATLFQIGEAYEKATVWHERRPDLRRFPMPPETKPYAAPPSPQGPSRKELEQLENDVVVGLARWGIPLLEEDVQPLVASLYLFHEEVRALDSGSLDGLEAHVHTHVSTLSQSAASTHP